MTNGRLYSPKRRSVSTKRSLPHHARVADKCRSIDLFASIGGICRRRFTVPKYLGSKVRAASQSALAFKVGLQSCPVNLLNRKGSQLRVGRVRRNVRDQSVKLKEHKQLLPHYQWSKISMGVL